MAKISYIGFESIEDVLARAVDGNLEYLWRAAYCYEHGDGVVSSIETANAYYLVAARSGCDRSRVRINWQDPDKLEMKLLEEIARQKKSDDSTFFMAILMAFGIGFLIG